MVNNKFENQIRQSIPVFINKSFLQFGKYTRLFLTHNLFEFKKQFQHFVQIYTSYEGEIYFEIAIFRAVILSCCQPASSDITKI